jgi:ribonuclease P/MRP protein subunit RPP40
MEARDSGKPLNVIYMNISKEFEKIPHKRLLAKLKAKGIREEIMKWMETG